MKKDKLVSIIILCVSFIVIRFPLFELHKMKQWPLVLFIVCGVVVLTSTILKAKILPITTSISYLFGFVLAYLFNSDGIDAGGGKTNNLWIIWTVTIVIVVIVSIIVEAILRNKDNN